MHTVKILVFLWFSSFISAVSGYYLLSLIIPSKQIFGALYRMFLYHWSHPIQYISLTCFFFGIISTITIKLYPTKTIWKQIGFSLLICFLTIVISSPFGGILWHFHDMQSGHFPDNWSSILICKGSLWGLELGWIIILLSIPYNIAGIIVAFLILNKAFKLEAQNA